MEYSKLGLLDMYEIFKFFEKDGIDYLSSVKK